MVKTLYLVLPGLDPGQARAGVSGLHLVHIRLECLHDPGHSVGAQDTRRLSRLLLLHIHRVDDPAAVDTGTW